MAVAKSKKRGNNGNIKKEKILYDHDVDSEKAAVDKIIKALINNRGRQYLAAQELGISRKTLYSYRQKWPEIEEITQEFRGQLVDTAEMSLEAAAMQGESWAVTFVLNCLARDRGYGNKVEQTTDATLRVIYGDDGNGQNTDNSATEAARTAAEVSFIEGET